MDSSASSGRRTLRRLAAGTVAMALVGSSVGISRTLVHAPLFAAQAIRYAVAVVLLLALARAASARVVRPRGREWLWLAGIAATGLVLFNVAIVRGVAHAEPAVIAVAVACVPVVLGIAGPLLQHQAPRRTIVLAAVVVTAGSVLVEGTGRTDLAGVGWAALALACEAAFTLLAVPVRPGRRPPQPVPPDSPARPVRSSRPVRSPTRAGAGVTSPGATATRTRTSPSRTGGPA